MEYVEYEKHYGNQGNDCLPTNTPGDIYLASLLVQLRNELVLRPIHRPALSSHGDERDAALRVVGVNELAEGLASLLVLWVQHQQAEVGGGRRRFCPRFIVRFMDGRYIDC